MEKLKIQLEIIRMMNMKPNYSELGRIYGIDRRTVKKYWEGYKGKPKKRNKSSKLDKYLDKIKTLLTIKGITIRAVYERLKDEEENIGTYSNLKRYVKKRGLIKNKKIKGHPRFETPPGMQAQVDWKEDILLHSKGGDEFRINVFNYKLGYSRYCYFEYKSTKTQKDLFECLIGAFRKTGGVPKEILFDNMKTVVDIIKNDRNRNGKGGIERRINNKMRAFAKDFGFRVRLCKPRHSYTKGKVEASNKFISWVLAYDYDFKNEEELKGIIKRINEKVNTQISQATNLPPILLFQKEKEYLSHLPDRYIIESYMDYSLRVKVQKDSLIYYRGERYSVPPRYIGKMVDVKIGIEENEKHYLYIYYNTELIAIHEIGNKKINYIPSHYMTLMSNHIREREELNRVCSSNLERLDTFLGKEEREEDQKDL
jgi:transposase